MLRQQDKMAQQSESVSAAATTAASPLPTIVLIGNPNTGKSTLFHALTGLRQHVGNYPGVTVERRVGRMQCGGREFEVVDLPGTYSLAPRSPDEMLSINVLLGRDPAEREPDLVVCVVDASNLERNLFLVSQLLDLHLPMVVALNMTDVARRKGTHIDCDRLAEILGVPVVPVQANRRRGIEELKQAICRQAGRCPKRIHDPFSVSLRERLDRLRQSCPDDCSLKRFAMNRMLFDCDGYITSQFRDQIDPEFAEAIDRERKQLEQETGQTSVESESLARFTWIKQQLEDVVRQTDGPARSWSDRLDYWLTHGLVGFPVVFVTMALMFQLVFWLADPASALIDYGTAQAAEWVDSIVPPGTLNSLLIDGVINGVGSVLVFLPQIAFLFLVIALLEDCGYLSRAAFLADRLLSRVGLSGMSLIPLLSSFACAIPGIMATRVIRDHRERLVTILIAPLMSCSARLPVYVLFISAFVPGPAWIKGVVMLAMYLVGIVTAIVVAWVLRRFVFRTGVSSFVLELPEYKIPDVRNVLFRIWEGCSAFVRDAGTIIFAVTILVWAAAYFPHSDSRIPAPVKQRQAELSRQLAELNPEDDQAAELQLELARVDHQLQAFYLQDSFLGRAGRWIEPVVRPLGWDWRIGSAVIASFPAREVVVSTVGVLFGLGSDQDEGSQSLRETLKRATWDSPDPELNGRPLFTLPVALSIMVFFALCAQCVSTLAVIWRETNQARWAVFTFVYMTGLAYVAAFLTYQIGNRLMG